MYDYIVSDSSMQSWHLPISLCPLREFPVQQGNAYTNQILSLEGVEVNSISVGPGRKVKLLPVQELVASEEQLQKFCKAAMKKGVVLWGGISVHLQFLRYIYLVRGL